MSIFTSGFLLQGNAIKTSPSKSIFQGDVCILSLEGQFFLFSLKEIVCKIEIVLEHCVHVTFCVFEFG